jgi:2-keto-4-pentenoate hydratase/2-oxohepta-3-ene-1,7-dioic acid hydratase in catechol pathway
MRIIRFEDGEGNVGYGRPVDESYARAERLTGDLFAGLEPTGETMEVGRLLAPLAPVNILCIGLNYRRHADETGATYPERPILFIKPTTTVIGPGDPIVLPAISTEVDYECELAAVIGKTARNVSEDDALGYVLGYTAANDVSARDWQNRFDRQWARGKSFDTFCPLGPVLVTADAIPDPNNLRVKTRVSGETLQDSSTADMIFGVREIVSYLSRGMTLLPGTVILTGTPEGVGMGRKPPRWLQNGEVCEIEVENIGTLRNPVRSESPGDSREV